MLLSILLCIYLRIDLPGSTIVHFSQCSLICVRLSNIFCSFCFILCSLCAFQHVAFVVDRSHQVAPSASSVHHQVVGEVVVGGSGS